MTKAQPGVKVAVLGASPREERYSYQAVKMLRESGFQPIPVHPRGHEVLGLTAMKSLDDIADDVDTLTVYVGPKISDGELERILRLQPRRVIFNPGTENRQLADKICRAGIEVIEICTLVMLRTEQF